MGLLVSALVVLLACASGRPPAPQALDRIYRPGADRSEGAKRTPRQVNELASRRVRDPETGALALGPELRALLGSRLSEAAGVDVYRVRVKRGQGYSARWTEHCDSVVFDAAGRIVTSYRSEGRC